MTFADRLEELLKRDTQTAWEVAENRLALNDLLANNADAILELVRAADKLMRLYKKSVDVGPHNNPNTEANICRCINEALAKLNGEQT